jgi:hypothetical protein
MVGISWFRRGLGRGFALSGNVSLLELVAAYGKLFFHNRPSEVMKGKLTIYRKTSHKF